jgi:hypothetical protein
MKSIHKFKQINRKTQQNIAKKLGGEQHNEQVENVIAFSVKNRPSFAAIDKGRSAE